jgi:hypothetical protein
VVDTYNVYCDESTHLQNDGAPFMVLGAVLCPAERAREIAVRCREIKAQNGVAADFEAKWTKVSESKAQLYVDLLDYFFDEGDLRFRGVVAPKEQLDHQRFNQNHDDWYYKMQFRMLEQVLTPADRFRVYIDIKDTRSKAKVDMLHRVLANNMYDFDREIIERVQQVRSHEAEQVQLADLMIGAVNYANRHLDGNPGKEKFIERLRARSGYDLTRSTLYGEKKFNLFHWRAQ